MAKPKGKTVSEMLGMARDWGLTGYSKLKKSDLAKLLSKSLKHRSSTELLDLAKQLGLRGYSRLKKTELARKLAIQLKSSTTVKKAAAPAKKSPIAKAKRTATGSARTRRKASVRRQRITSPASAKTTAKASTKAPKIQTQPVASKLPASYHDGQFLLLPRDPDWLYCYWDPTEAQQAKLEKQASLSIRLLRREDDNFVPVKLIPISRLARSWHLQVDSSAHSYQIELGGLNAGGDFVAIMNSNVSDALPNTPSEQVTTEQVHYQTDAKIENPKIRPDTKQELAEQMHHLSTATSSQSMDSAAALDSRSWLESGRGPGSPDKRAH